MGKYKNENPIQTKIQKIVGEMQNKGLEKRMKDSRKLKLVFGLPLASAASLLYTILRICDERNNGPTMNRTTR